MGHLMYEVLVLLLSLGLIGAGNLRACDRSVKLIFNTKIFHMIMMIQLSSTCLDFLQSSQN